jgi:hypothetical protein
MKRFFLVGAFVLLASLCCAQVPACQINFGPWTDTNASAPSDNRTTGCAYWVMTYQVTGFSAVSLTFQSAAGASGPGAFGTFSGTLNSGSNPSTSVACSTPANCTATFNGVVGWYKIVFGSHTGSGTIQGTLQGYKAFVPLGGNTSTGAGCPGTIGSPCVVAGGVASGSPPTLAPVPVAGFDGTNLQPLKTDTGGNAQTAAIGDAAFISGQQAVTGTAAALASHAARSVCVVALLANTIPVYVGAAGVTTGTGMQLSPGQGVCQPVSNTNLIFVVASTTGASVTWSSVN